MNREELLEKLLGFYQQSFDLKCPYVVCGERYHAYAAFHVVSAKYVLSKKAELWRAQCYEHAFFKITDTFREEELQKFLGHITEFMEPEMVRQGKKYPPPNHMYTYLTGVFISSSVQQQVRKKIQTFKFVKNYCLTIRGYCEARIVVIDVEQQTLYANKAARELMKGYKNIL